MRTFFERELDKILSDRIENYNNRFIVNVPGFYTDEISIEQEGNIISISCKNKENSFYREYEISKEIDSVKHVNGQLIINFKDTKKEIKIESE